MKEISIAISDKAIKKNSLLIELGKAELEYANAVKLKDAAMSRRCDVLAELEKLEAENG